jgi:GNAT superfamily N-acetyltransferase/catechol 2,3-dioxygenase-like lactoylglutathione lyase family enzyme
VTDCVRCSKRDYDQIVSELPAFWGDDRMRALHHPMLLNEFGDWAHVIREGEQVVAYLFGFVAPGPLAYIHLVGVRESHRHRGLARRLYDHFTARAVARGCRQLRAITSLQNTGSIQFHRSLGFEPTGEPGAGGVPVVKDYGGPGVDRVVLEKRIGTARITGVIPQLRTTDLAGSIAFYTTKVGLTLAFQYSDFYAGIRAGGHVFHAKLVDERDPSIDFVDRGDHFHLYLETDDADAAAETCKGNGVHIVKDVHDTPWGTRELVIKDDQGHTVYIGAPGKG